MTKAHIFDKVLSGLLQVGIAEQKSTLVKWPSRPLFPPGPVRRKKVEHGYKGKGSLLNLVTDKEGKPLRITTTSAKGNERIQALVLLDQLQISGCKNTKRMTICEADKGYDSDELRMQMLKRVMCPLFSI